MIHYERTVHRVNLFKLKRLCAKQIVKLADNQYHIVVSQKENRSTYVFYVMVHFLQVKETCQVLGEESVPQEGTAPLVHLRKKAKKRRRPPPLSLSLFAQLESHPRSVIQCLKCLSSFTLHHLYVLYSSKNRMQSISSRYCCDYSSKCPLFHVFIIVFLCRRKWT